MSADTHPHRDRVRQRKDGFVRLLVTDIEQSRSPEMLHKRKRGRAFPSLARGQGVDGIFAGDQFRCGSQAPAGGEALEAGIHRILSAAKMERERISLVLKLDAGKETNIGNVIQLPVAEIAKIAHYQVTLLEDEKEFGK